MPAFTWVVDLTHHIFATSSLVTESPPQPLPLFSQAALGPLMPHFLFVFVCFETGTPCVDWDDLDS